MNFAIGLVAGALLGIPMLLWRPRWLIWLPLAMPLCGAVALAIAPLKGGQPSALHGLAFHAAALAWLALLGGYAAWIRWGMRRLPEAEEALARLRRETAPYRPAARLLAVLPLAATGLAAAALLWPRRPEHRGGPPEAPQWASLVARRLGFDPGDSLGIVHPTWEPQGAWLCGDLGAYAPPDPAELLARARANGCDFLTLLMPEGAPLSSLPPHPGLAILRGFVREKGDRLLFLEEGDVILALPRDDGAEGWDELYALYRAGGPFIGILGLAGAERLSARDARSRWCPRVALLGGVWDRFLARGFRLSGAAAASSFQDPARHFWPGEFARTHVWCRGRAPGDVLDGLRRGCAWAVEGGIVRELDFGLTAPCLRRPARMGEAARIAPGDEGMVELALDVPPADFAGRPNALDEVELISNFGGEPAVLARFRNVREAARLTHRLPPAEDRNGGVGFYVRARGWRQLDGGARLWFHTNPIRVLVRAGQAPPPGPATSPVRVASVRRPPEPPPSSPKPTTAQPAPPPPDGVAARLAALGLPPSVRVVHIESFQKPPAQDWHGEYVSIVGDRGPAMGDEELRVELLRSMDLAVNARLFFLCYAVECTRLTAIARLGERAAPHQFVRELPERQWVPLDLALAEDFLAPGGAGPPDPKGRLNIQAIEWRGSRLGPLSRFYITDVVVYEPTPASRQELAWRRAVELDGDLREALGRSAPLSARPRAEAAAKRLAALSGQLNPAQGPVAAGELEAAERALDELAGACHRLRLQAAMPKAFGIVDPAFAATLAPAATRCAGLKSALRTPQSALAPAPQLTASWELAAAGGEAESVRIAVIALWDKLEGVDIRVSDFLPLGGGGWAEAARPQVTLELVDAVEVRPRPDVPREQAGLVPDPLRPFQPFDVEPGEARCVLLTVEAPPDLLPGEYEAAVTIEPRGVAPVRAAVKLRRWGFALEGQPLPFFAPLGEPAIAAGLGLGKSLPPEPRRALYELLLRHRISPIPLLGGSEEADLAEALFCLERGAELVVLREAASSAPGVRDPEVVRAARQAMRLAEAGWPRRGALLLPLAPQAEPERAKMAAFARTLAQERPGLLLAAGGEGEPPGDLIAHFWRRPLGEGLPRRPRYEEAEVRLSRTARREAWELLPASPEAAAPNLLLTSPLLHARLIPWLAWQHGVRAIFLRGVARWNDPDDLREAVLLYPPASKLPRVPDPREVAVRGSLRLAALRDGIEDYALLRLLWDRARQLRERTRGRDAPAAPPLADAERLLAEAAVAAGSFERPCRDPLVLSALRTRVARELERLDAAWWAEVDAAEDLPPPPPELSVKSSEGHVVLSWARSPDPKAAAYSIYRSRHPAIGFVRLNPAPVAGLSYIDRTAQAEATYHYFVRSCRDAAVEGPRSQTVAVRTQAAPRVVWLSGPPPGAPGPWRVALRLEGPGAGGLLPLVRPQIAWEVVGGASAPRAFEEMARQPDATWSFDIPDPGWGELAGKSIRLLVRIVDRQNRVAAQPVERREAIEPRPAVRNP